MEYVDKLSGWDKACCKSAVTIKLSKESGITHPILFRSNSISSKQYQGIFNKEHEWLCLLFSTDWRFIRSTTAWEKSEDHESKELMRTLYTNLNKEIPQLKNKETERMHWKSIELLINEYCNALFAKDYLKICR